MTAEKLDLEKVKEFLTKQLKDLTEASQVKFRALNKAVKSEFGTGLFIPQLSTLVRSLRPDLAKPAKKAGKRRGRKPVPKPGARRLGRPPGRTPGRPPGRRASRVNTSNGEFLVQIGRSLKLVASRDRVQAAVDKHLASGQKLAKLKVYSLRPVGITTKIVLE